ncbi:AAA family ATPase [Adlercreutzia sp. ZJ242]|uniref:AAA family ATPase n=1 Tax=Adlercreutzia sp. ZJ242 TaxID=2709409 RepID=UPI0013EAFD5E|nr:AAA family ATPase [Adlercreutzia sp. ZJ242]
MASDTVFQPSFGNKPDKIVGREAVTEGILSGLGMRPGHRDRATLVIGQRGMGKTALLLEIADQALDRGFIAARVAASANMLDEIVETVQIKGSPFVKERKSKIKGFNAGALGFSFGLTFSDEVASNYGFRTKLSLLCDKLAENDKGILLLIDEVQANTDDMRTLATTYQHLVGEGKNIAIVMAGLPTAVSSVLNDNILTFLNRARKVRLEPLSLEPIRVYYRLTFNALRKEFPSELLDEAVSATRGFPYLLQLVGYYLEEYSAGSASIDDGMVSDAIASAKRDLEADVFATTLKPLSDTDVKFLEAMAVDEGPSKVSDIQARLGVSAGYVQSYRARLIEAGVVASERRGELELVVPYLGEYLRNRE